MEEKFGEERQHQLEVDKEKAMELMQMVARLYPKAGEVKIWTESDCFVVHIYYKGLNEDFKTITKKEEIIKVTYPEN